MKRTLVVAQAAAAEKSGVVEGGKSKSGRSLVSKHSQSDGTGGESKSEAFRNWVIDAWKDKRLTDKDICELAWHATEAGQMKHKVGLLVAPLSAPSLNAKLIVWLVSCVNTQRLHVHAHCSLQVTRSSWCSFLFDSEANSRLGINRGFCFPKTLKPHVLV